MTESKSLEFRAEFFNAFNTPSFAAGPLTLNVGTATASPTTGMPIFAPNPSGPPSRAPVLRLGWCSSR